MRTVGIIPARFASSRLPGKLLLAETGKPLLQYIWEAACRAESLSEAIVAADDEKIKTVVEEFGGRCELTGEHESGTDRVAEVVTRCCEDAEIVVNLQGDEPELDPKHIDLLVNSLKNCPQAQMATLASPCSSLEELNDTANVKVVRSESGNALYFSRSPIPFVRDRSVEEVFSAAEKNDADNPWLIHIGIYAYRRDFLLDLTQKPTSSLERLEKLEQLRALEAGATIKVEVVESRAVGIDTSEDYTRFVERMKFA